MDIYGIADRMVPDPIEIGGDGKPGFNCAACKGRTRVFDYMKRDHDDPSTYCDAAIVPHEDLDVLKSQGLHCDKVIVGSALAYRQSGFPVFDGVSKELISLFLKLKNEGVYDRWLEYSRPTDSCPITTGEGSALSVAQLTGVWVITFVFALIALVVKYIPKPSWSWLNPSKWKVPEKVPLNSRPLWSRKLSRHLSQRSRKLKRTTSR
eukprot:14477207-Ditylum_brightwellii.AAC.1